MPVSHPEYCMTSEADQIDVSVKRHELKIIGGPHYDAKDHPEEQP
jgi:hypothetical protein